MPKRRFISKKPLRFSKNGCPLCRYCDKEVKRPRRTFCSSECVKEWKIRKSSSYARKCLVKRDKGICYRCGLDTVALKKQGKKFLVENGKKAYWHFAKSHNMPPERKTWWDCHHLVAVAEGGGQCGLENLATICYPCHKKETKALQKRLSMKKKMEASHRAIPLPPSSVFDAEAYSLFYSSRNRRPNKDWYNKKSSK